MKQNKIVTKKVPVLLLTQGLLVWLALAGIARVIPSLGAEIPTDPGWPRVAIVNGVTNTVYQPQLDSWDGQSLTARSAVAIQPAGALQPSFGIISITARTVVDKVQRLVQLQDLQVASARFPATPDQSEGYLEQLRRGAPRQIETISLDRLEVSLAALQGERVAQGQPLKNEPPTIVFSSSPALQITVDGPAVYQSIEETSLQRVVNTRAFLARDSSGRHFLHLFDGYLTAPALTGPWTAAGLVPKDLKVAEKKALEARAVDLLCGQPDPETKRMPSLQKTPAPKIVIATTPTELIVTAGEAQWLEIRGTELLYMANTSGNVFKHLRDARNYVLISGRWFCSTALDGPWEYVSGRSLPPDFASIPDDSPKENVKASIPGTHQAQEALIANMIPQTSKVNRQKAQMNPPHYDGLPQLEPIVGTPLQFVVNCATPVIKVDDKTYYACQSGAWFVATSLRGPWAVATFVPAVIYSIPPSSPVYYVTYVKVFRHDDEFVWVGHTAGYSGTVVNVDGVVVYGTGYSYRPWVGAIYISAPVTYGYYASPCWTPWAGWSYGFAAGWAWGASYSYWCACPAAPYWGPYGYQCYASAYNAHGGVTAWGSYGWAGTSGTMYHQSGAWSSASRGAAGFNGWSGNQWAADYGRAYNSTTGARTVGQRGAVENVYTGNYAYGGRAAGYNPNTGKAAAGGQVTVGNAYNGNSATVTRGALYNSNTDRATSFGGVQTQNGSVGHVGNDVYATKDGNVYRADGRGGWNEVSQPRSASGGATTAPLLNQGARPSSSIASPGNQGATRTMQSTVFPSQRSSSGLQSDAQARRLGEQRTQSFQANRPQFGGDRASSRGGPARRRSQ